MSGWILAIDFGTTSTAAARSVGHRVEVIQLQSGPRMPSMVFWREGTGATGRLVLGNEAEELSTLAPWCLERTPKARLGEDFILLGDKQLRPVEIVAAILREVYDEALSLSGGEPPAEVRLTHPARWRKTLLDELARAAKLAGITDPVFVPEPVAAAVHFASERLKDGEHVAVYDLGGGTLDTAVLKRTGETFEVVGRTGGNEELGGEDFDDLLYRQLAEQLPGDKREQLRSADERQDRIWAQANRELLRQARRAKEGLSRNPEYAFYMPPPVDQELSATVSEFEGLITPTVRGTISELERTILAADLQVADLNAVYLAGGSSRIPLVGRLIQERLGVAPEHLDDPKAVISLGAARLGRSDAQESGIHDSPLSQADSPIPPLPGADPNATRIASGHPGGSGGSGAVPPPPPPPPPRSAPEPAHPAAAQSPATGGTGGSKGGGNRNKILAGIAAAVVVLGGVAAAVTLGGGGGGGDTTGGDTTAEPAVDTSETVKMIDPEYRDCTPADEASLIGNATAGLDCGAPAGFTSMLLQYETIGDLEAAFESQAGGLKKGGFCDTKWNRRTDWVFNSDPNTTVGEIACTSSADSTSDVIFWTDSDRMAMGVLRSSANLHAKTFNAWDGMIHE
ncbi:MAG: Hsp70 family protein [Solirubrobacterales bacterium]